MTGLDSGGALNHTGMGEEPPDVFCSLASLIVEGRVPRPGDARGYGEGPHAPQHPGSPAVVRHKCSMQDYMCKKDENFRKHMLLLWQNNVPVSIEVLICSDCRVGRQKASSVEFSTIPEPGSILLEQWTVSLCSAAPSQSSPIISSRSLFQAVRSYLHFSQLSAWYSKSGGIQPKNVLFRITIPGEAFSSKFTSVPEEHAFPRAVVGGATSVQVVVRSLPRSENIPRVLCSHLQENNDEELPPLSNSSSNSTDISESVASEKEDDKLAVAGALSWKETEHNETDLRKTLVRNLMNECAGSADADLPRSDSMDSMLGDSLLDPPQSLQKIPPKRYQSPSRCGSPSLEAPDHLLFGHYNDPRHYKAENGRLARQDLLRRRDLNLLHDLHPRVLPLAGNQAPRLSLPTKAIGNLQAPRPTPMGPYRAFPPERLVPCRPMDDSGPPKCTISGKHICNVEDQHDRRLSRWDRSHLPPEQQPRVQPEPEPEGKDLGAKRKENKRLLPGPDHSDSEEDGIEVAEYVNVPDVGLYPFEDEARQASLAKKGLDDLLGELQLSKSACSSRRSSVVKDEDSLFPKKCKKKKTTIGELIEMPPLPLQPLTTQVYRAETQCSSPLPAIAAKYVPIKRNDAKDEEEGVCSSDEEEDQGLITERLQKPAMMTRLRSFSENLKTGLNEEVATEQELILEPLDLSFDDRTRSFDEFDDECPSPGDDNMWRKDNTIPTMTQMDSFRKTLNSATSMVFHRSAGLPLSSSPAPLRKGKNNFDYDSSINKPTDIKRALFQSQMPKVPKLSDKENQEMVGRRVRHPSRKILSASAPATITSTNLLGSFEESVLNGRLEPVSTVEGFTAEIGASGSFHPKHKTLPVTVFFYTLCDNSNISSPYLGHINLGKKGYRVPQKGTIQVTLFNPLGTVVKMFVVMYDLSDMPSNSQTFLRQRTLYMPTDVSSNTGSEDATQKWLRYLVHLRFASSKSGKIYLHTDIRMIIFRKSDLDTATDHAPGKGFELRSFTKGPINPKFSPRR